MSYILWILGLWDGTYRTLKYMWSVVFLCVCVCDVSCGIVKYAVPMQPRQIHTHSFLCLLKEFQSPLLSSWKDSSFPFLRFIFLPCPFLFRVPFPSFLSVWAEVTVVQVHRFHLWFDGHCPCSHQNKFFPYLFLFSSSCSILVRVGQANLSSLMDYFVNKLNNAVLSCQRPK